MLFRTFALYRTRRDKSRGWKPRDAETGLEDREENAITGVNEILYVLEDFKYNGYLNRRHTVISQTKPGRIVWSRTIHKTTPIISHRQPFYANPYMKSNVRHDEEMVQKIHRHLVGKFCKTWGWLVGDIKAEESPMPCTPKEAIIILSAELQSCFVQREIDLIRSMIRYFKEKRGDKEEKRDEYMLTPEFEQIWENVCGYVLGNCYDDYKARIPKAKFFPVSDSANSSAKPKTWTQKPDILCRKDTELYIELYILDAKYYTFRLPDSDELDDEGEAAWKAHFPGWGDMVKQFVYRYTIERAIDQVKKRAIKQDENKDGFGGVKIAANALLFPGGHTEKKPYLYHGTVRIPEAKYFYGIQLWSLDVEKMLKAYTDTDKQKRETIRKELLDKLAKKAWAEEEAAKNASQGIGGHGN